MTTRFITLLAVTLIAIPVLAKADATPPTPTPQEISKAALDAQAAALRALQAAYAAMAATSSEEQRRAMVAAESATVAAQAAADKVLAMAPSAPTPVKANTAEVATASTAGTEPKSVSPLDPPRPITAVIKAGQANNIASITLTRNGIQDDNGVNTFRAVTLSAPVGKGPDPTRLATLDGLANSAAVQLSYTRRKLFNNDTTSGLWSVKAAAKVGSEQFTYNELADLKEATATRTPYSASLAASINPKDTSILYYARYEYQRKYEASKNKVLCQLASPGDCVYGPAGTPLRKFASIVTLGSRYLGATRAFAPSLNYDTKSKVKGIDLPLYLFGQDNTSPLAGGVGAGWRSDTKDTTFYVFVGTPLDFWGM
jgi:hypothetical protein